MVHHSKDFIAEATTGRQKETNKLSDFACGVLTPLLSKGDARPVWKPHLIVSASRGGVNLEGFSVEMRS